jgi:hypothetical protein
MSTSQIQLQQIYSSRAQDYLLYVPMTIGLQIQLIRCILYFSGLVVNSMWLIPQILTLGITENRPNLHTQESDLT